MATVLEASYQAVTVADGHADDLRAVRFDDECVLIPEAHRSRMPRLLQRSYSLTPLFRRRDSQSPNPIDEAASQDVIPNVSRPSLWTRKSLHRRASSADCAPLTPCLVHRDPSAPARPPRTRRPSLPLPATHTSPSGTTSSGLDLATVPLRPCCPNCFNATDACLSLGDAWRERFTRAARSRRNASVDYQLSRAEKRETAAAIAAAAATPGVFAAVAVDEVAQAKAPVHKATSPEPQADESEKDADGLLSIPDDLLLGAMLSRRMLSPIPSRNGSSEDLPADLCRDESHETAGLLDDDADGEGGLVDSPVSNASPSASPEPRTPSPPTHRHPSASPKTRFRLPSGADILRVGADVLRGVSSLSSPTL